MSLINVTTWSGRKLHLADRADEKKRTYGTYLPTLCDTIAGVRPGDRWAWARSRGLVTQEFIDSLPPCKKCAKRAEKIQAAQP